MSKYLTKNRCGQSTFCITIWLYSQTGIDPWNDLIILWWWTYHYHSFNTLFIINSLYLPFFCSKCGFVCHSFFYLSYSLPGTFFSLSLSLCLSYFLTLKQQIIESLSNVNLSKKFSVIFYIPKLCFEISQISIDRSIQLPNYLTSNGSCTCSLQNI